MTIHIIDILMYFVFVAILWLFLPINMSDRSEYYFLTLMTAIYCTIFYIYDWVEIVYYINSIFSENLTITI